MEREQYLDALAVESVAFDAAVSTAPLGARVPPCPAWTVADLVYHLGEVHYFWGEVARRRLAAPEVEPPVRPPDGELVAWAAGQAVELGRILGELDPATPVWTWAPQKDVGFIVRRMAHETAVHRWDAESAVGQPGPIEAELASDGIDEFLTFFIDDGRHDGGRRIGGSVHLHATDTPGEWLVREEPDGALTVTAEHAKGDAAVRGPASDLLLALWRRVGLDRVEVLGDRDVAERLVARTTVE
jgi:uncharacterized protein (TIGR03083 family)